MIRFSWLLIGLWLGLVVPLGLGLTGCASYIPDKEIAIAEAAVEAARGARADSYAPRLFQQAQESLRLAKRAHQEREFGVAKEYAVDARVQAERAENFAVLQRERGDE